MKKGAICFVTLAACVAAARAEAPAFSAIQPELFAVPQSLSNALADFDGDGDSDLAVSFVGGAIRLYRNDSNTFVEMGVELGLPTAGPEVRGLGWGDFDGDGDPDLHAGVSGDEGAPARNLLFRNDDGTAFVEVAQSLGMKVFDADSRQANWVDYDNDGDLDLFSAQRSGTNRLFRNDGGRFTAVSLAVGLADPRRTVGSCWFDMDQDGDLDVFLANQQADKDALYRNDGGAFVDIAPQLRMHQPERTLAEGGVGCTVGDYDNDGLLDLLVAAYVGGENSYSHAHLFMNTQGRFVDVLGDGSPLRAADHGVQWADVDRDGDLDLSLTDTFPDNGRHPLFRNELPDEVAGRSLQVRVLDREGRATRSGSEVRLYATDGKLLGARLVATGDGYGSQSIVPVHFGLAEMAEVTVEVTFLTREGRKQKRIEGVDPRGWAGRTLVVKADD
jgi:hypothetical protein